MWLINNMKRSLLYTWLLSMRTPKKHDHHRAIHKLVDAIRELDFAYALCTQPSAIDSIRKARVLIWEAGEEIGVDVGGQLMDANELN